MKDSATEKMTILFKDHCNRYLSTLGLALLRSYGRHIGVAQATEKKKQPFFAKQHSLGGFKDIVSHAGYCKKTKRVCHRKAVTRDSDSIDRRCYRDITYDTGEKSRLCRK